MLGDVVLMCNNCREYNHAEEEGKEMRKDADTMQEFAQGLFDEKLDELGRLI